MFLAGVHGRDTASCPPDPAPRVGGSRGGGRPLQVDLLWLLAVAVGNWPRVRDGPLGSHVQFPEGLL